VKLGTARSFYSTSPNDSARALSSAEATAAHFTATSPGAASDVVYPKAAAKGRQVQQHEVAAAVEATTRVIMPAIRTG
jgi:hypothetical protein